MEKPTLYRKRLIPQECILLKDDEILIYTDDFLLTRWNALRSKKDLHHGFSCYYLNEGFKISRFYREDNTLLYHYCDIIQHEFTPSNELIVTDLLADVVVYPDDSSRILDLDELAVALEDNLLTSAQMKSALLSLNRLLNIIYDGDFMQWCEPMNITK